MKNKLYTHEEMLATTRTYADSVLLHSPSPKNWVSSAKNIRRPEDWETPSSLRDRFAGLAMQTYVVKCTWHREEMCREAYKWADAMLVERENSYDSDLE